MGTRDGIIIATIITTHMPRNVPAVPTHVWSGIRIHAIDIVQPPGIGMSSMADMEPHHAIVIAALATKTSADTPRNARSVDRSNAMARGRATTTMTSAPVLVVAAPPDAGL